MGITRIALDDSIVARAGSTRPTTRTTFAVQQRNRSPQPDLDPPFRLQTVTAGPPSGRVARGGLAHRRRPSTFRCGHSPAVVLFGQWQKCGSKLAFPRSGPWSMEHGRPLTPGFANQRFADDCWPTLPSPNDCQTRVRARSRFECGGPRRLTRSANAARGRSSAGFGVNRLGMKAHRTCGSRANEPRTGGPGIEPADRRKGSGATPRKRGRPPLSPSVSPSSAPR